MEIKNLKQTTNSPYLNSFNLEIKLDNGKDFTYYFASRKPLECVQKRIFKHEKSTDAVRTVAYFKKDYEIFVVLLKEFRYVANDFIIGTPAGLVEENETELDALQRELNEEIGAKIKKVEKSFDACYTSIGAIDESVACFFVEIEPNFGKQHLDQTENINFFTTPLSKLPEILNQVTDYQSRYLLETFYYQQENKKLKAQLTELQK